MDTYEYAVEAFYPDGDWKELECFDTLKQAKNAVAIRISASMKSGKQWRILERVISSTQIAFYVKK